MYAGGDIASQQAGVVAAFQQQFPDIKLTMVVDYSKFHDVRIDTQFANGKLIPDVTHLQTLQDFTRWKQQGRLLPYKPAGFSKAYDAFKDPDGAWVAIGVIGFSFMYNGSRITGTPPKNPEQFVDARWGAIASAYPNDDHAVLYLYSLYAQTCGWDWIAKLADQQMRFGRDTNSPGDALSSGAKNIGIGRRHARALVYEPGDVGRGRGPPRSWRGDSVPRSSRKPRTRPPRRSTSTGSCPRPTSRTPSTAGPCAPT